MKDSSGMSYPDLSPFFPFLLDELVGPFAALAVAFLLSLAVVGTLLVVRWGGWPFVPRSASYFDAVLTPHARVRGLLWYHRYHRCRAVLCVAGGS